MRRISYIRISAFVCVVLGLAGVAGDHRLSGQAATPGAAQFEIGAVRHETRAESQTLLDLPNTNEFPSESETVSPPPTRSSFMATWLGVTHAKGYLLDVSTSSSFDSFVDGYHDLDVGAVTGRVVTGLSRGTTYYYRVRAYDAAGAGNYSDVMTATTVPTVGLIIHPTFDSSITGNPNAAAIEAMISRAISFHESLFADPITIQIRFRYSTTAPDGMPLSMSTLALTYILLYEIPWSSYISALRADATTSNDAQANASLPRTALSGNIRPSSAAGRAVGLNTPPAMFANGSVGQGGPYDAIVTLNSAAPYQFSRSPSASNFDAQRTTEHEVDEAIGLGSRLGGNGNDLRPQDLFSWSSPGHRNITTSGPRYFSINGGVTHIVNFNQNPDGDLGDWFSEHCPQTHSYVQNAFACPGQYSDISATSPEGINLDVVGYDLSATASSSENDFNNDGHPDYLLYNAGTSQTGVWYLDNNVLIGSAAGPTLPAGWQVVGVADFNRDQHPDYLLFNSSTRETVIWYLSGVTRIAANHGPTLPGGWGVKGIGDFNVDGYPDLVLYKADTHQTVVWFMHNNVHVNGSYGPTVPGGWVLVGVADFNKDGNPDYLLWNPSTRQTVIWYMSRTTRLNGRTGPTITPGYELVGTADFSQDGHPDYLLYNPSSHQTAIWYLNNYQLVGSASGPTVPVGWTLVAP
jgi:hypothetical protein